jgi:dihydrolipoamide dehydrogenase
MADRYDVVVIGAGPAGYVAAIRCAQLGMRVACIDRWRDERGEAALGGTCLNVGCIPSKALLEASEVYARVRDRVPGYGLKVSGLELDLGAMMAHKQQVVQDLTRGVAQLFKANKVESLAGSGRLLPGNRVELHAHGGGERVLEAGNVILAAGSVPIELKAAALAPPHVVDSSGALAFDAVPRRLAVIGAGIIGLELGSVWRRLGAEVIVLEAQEQFLTMADEQVAREALKQFTAQGLDIRLGARVLRSAVEGGAVAVTYQDAKGEHREQVDRLLVAVGRRPATQGLAAPETNLLLDEWGYVHVDEHCRTNLPGVYAVGDVVRGPMLAHKGMEEGVMVAERIAGGATEVNYDAIPSVVYTHPEIAWVGKTEQSLKAAGERYRVGSFPFAANGRARAMGEPAGLVKVLADEATDRVRGVHIIGAHASELIASAVLAMHFGASSEDIALTVFAHPTLSEALHEAALSVHGRALHAVQVRRGSRG